MTVKPIQFGTGRQLTNLAYVQTLADFFFALFASPSYSDKNQTAQAVISQINAGFLPPKIDDLTITENDIELLQQHVLQQFPTDMAAGNQYWQELIEPLEMLDETLSELRDVLMTTFDMYHYPNEVFMHQLDAYIGQASVLEIMAGQGYLSAGLRALNPARELVATDDQSWEKQPGDHIMPVTDVLNMDALDALNKYGQASDVILMSWAPDTDDIDMQVLNWVRVNAPKAKLLVIGEKHGATNSREFWQEAQLTDLTELNDALTSFDLIDEKIYLAR
ncbi:hypothetical protein [Weissella ceti]|uniref:SAM-dependent methyltransferase n=1 Tax=Weissella ceti TaxID=759620 RepID=A0A088GHJ0_9LACO|nr:hypothetical protein [Weissella ceti]AIM63436.1 SAM-dependent methyltransferase [Weissella ceti]